MTKKDLKRVLEIESVLTELFMRDYTDPEIEGWITGGHTFVEYEREYHYDSSETAHTRCTKCNMWVPF